MTNKHCCGTRRWRSTGASPTATPPINTFPSMQPPAALPPCHPATVAVWNFHPDPKPGPDGRAASCRLTPGSHPHVTPHSTPDPWPSQLDPGCRLLDPLQCDWAAAGYAPPGASAAAGGGADGAAGVWPCQAEVAAGGVADQLLLQRQRQQQHQQRLRRLVLLLLGPAGWPAARPRSRLQQHRRHLWPPGQPGWTESRACSSSSRSGGCSACMLVRL